MKRLIFLSFITVTISVVSILFSQNKVNKVLISEIESLARNEGDSKKCKWMVIDCPGWGTGDFEACVTNGDGNSCSCGDVTRDCNK